MKVSARITILMGILAFIALSGCADKTVVKMDPPWQRATGPVPTGQFMALAVADLDNDGDTDAIGGGSGTDVLSLWYGDGRGGWKKTVHIPIEGDVRGIAVGDIDEDGRKDILFSSQSKGRVGIQLWLNRPGDVWEKGQPPAEQGLYEGIKIADANYDGHLDIIAANATSETQGGIRVWLGDGKGGWMEQVGPVSINRYMDVALADLDKDGNIDIVGAGTGTFGALRVWMGDGKGGWSPTQTLEKGSYFRITIEDLDWDGNPDIVVGTYHAGIQIFYGDGKGNFEKKFSPIEKGSFWKVLLTTLEKDRTPVLIASSIDSNGLMCWRLEDDGFWRRTDFQLPKQGRYYDMERTDFDGDTRCDLCTASSGEGIKIWLGKGGSAGPSVAASQPGNRNLEKIKTLDKITENSVFSSDAGFPEYRIGCGDEVEITFWRGIEPSTHTMLVRPDGKISFGFVEDLYVDGLTPTQLDNQLTAEFSMFIRSPQLDIVVTKFNSKTVTFMGAILRLPAQKSGPGIYGITGKVTLLEMLSHAGGPDKDADMQKVSVRRADGRQLLLDLYKTILHGDETQNIILDDKDFVFVPRTSESETRVFVLGQVQRPGVFPIRKSANVLEAILLAGGFSNLANPAHTKIIRGGLPKPDVISSDIKKLLNENDQSQNHLLMTGDVVYVPRGRIGDIHVFLQNISPLLNFVLFPARFRDAYMYNDALRFDVGGSTPSANVNVTALP